jgi:UDP-N-acetylmuramate--alanine ligase
VTDVYAAGEPPLPGIDARALVSTFPAGAPVRHVDRSRLATELSQAARHGDLVLCLGAGDITAVPGELLTLLARRDGERPA